jgi:hypothetical protein
MRGFEPVRVARVPAHHPPILCVVVDTEEEFDWGAPFSRDNTATTSVAAQALAHDRIFDRFGIVPTYVVDWPVATSSSAVKPLKELLDAGRCEIGAQLHAWVSPPFLEEVNDYNSYAGNLPPELELAKLSQLTQAIAENFGGSPTVFKAGRYGLGSNTAVALAQLGYLVDTSIVPHTSFRAKGGPDFTAYGNDPFWFGPSTQPLLELPVTTAFCGWLAGHGRQMYQALAAPAAKSLRLGALAARTRALERIRLSPEGCDGPGMIRLIKSLARAGNQVFTLTYHSPSLVPGHTPYVHSQRDLDNMLAAITEVCSYFRDEMGGIFMSCSQIRETTLKYHP